MVSFKDVFKFQNFMVNFKDFLQKRALGPGEPPLDLHRLSVGLVISGFHLLIVTRVCRMSVCRMRLVVSARLKNKTEERRSLCGVSAKKEKPNKKIQRVEFLMGVY
jgi:hypothetical protein